MQSSSNVEKAKVYFAIGSFHVKSPKKVDILNPYLFDFDEIWYTC